MQTTTTRRRVLPPLFGRTRMSGSERKWFFMQIPGTPFTVRVQWLGARAGWCWKLCLKSPTRIVFVELTFDGPQAAANAAKRAIERWGETVRKL